MAIGLVVGLSLTAIMTQNPLGLNLEHDTLDAWFKLRGPEPVRDVVVLAVDEETMARWGGRVFDAREMGRLLLLLHDAGASAAILNFRHLSQGGLQADFPPDFSTSLEASGLAHLPIQVIAASPRNHAVTSNADRGDDELTRFALPQPETAAEDSPQYANLSFIVPPPPLLRAAAGVGHLRVTLDKAGRVRGVPLALPYNGRWYPAIALEAAARTWGQSIARLQTLGAAGETAPPPDSRYFRVGDRYIPTRRGMMLLNYPYRAANGDDLDMPASIRTLSVATMLADPTRLRGLRGKAVVIGPTAWGYTQYFTVPTGQRVPEVELQAVALDNILTRRYLDPAPQPWIWLLSLFACIGVGGFVASRQPWWGVVIALVSFVSLAAFSFGLFLGHIWLDIAPSALSLGVTFLIGFIARAREETRAVTRIGSTIEALHQVSELIAEQTHPHQLLSKVLNWVVDIMDATGSSALLLDESGQTLHFAAANGPISAELMPFTLKLGEGIAGWVAQHGEPAIVNDVSRDPRFNQSIDLQTGFSTEAILCVPLRVHNKMLGVIEVVNRVDGSSFNAADAELLAAVANQSAVVLENAHLYGMLNQRVEQSESELAVTNERLQTEKNLMQTVLESMTDGVIVTGADGLIQLLNPAAAVLLPELARPVQNHPLAELLPDLAASVASRLQHAATDGAATTDGAAAFTPVQLHRGDPDAPRLIEAHAAPLQSSDGTAAGFVIVFADVTEQRHIEQAKSDFVSFVAHEMRSPLTTIAGFSSMLQHGETAPDQLPSTSRTRFLGMIHDESERLTRLINNLLDVARIEAGRTIELHREAFDFAEVAHSVADSQRGYSRRHDIVCALPRVLPPVQADRDKVTQILINLVSNALKYSPGGTVTIAARPDGEWLQISVRDEGPGIAPEQRQRLFQRFGRTPPRAGDLNGPGERAKPTGTGLGLFLTKHLVERHGGRIWVESETGQGATFHFTLPLDASPALQST